MTDYHDNTIDYTYTARDQLNTLTAPGNKVWTYTYNALGQPTRVDMPNAFARPFDTLAEYSKTYLPAWAKMRVRLFAGMHTEYAYGTRNRLIEIAHKDGSTVKQSFGYTLDDDGTITRITHEDGSYWDYGYDGRNRLIAADRKSASGNIVAKYAKKMPLDTLSEYRKTYLAARGDNVSTRFRRDADNMLTKVEPFEDDFSDGNYTGWTVSGPWSASTGQMINTADPGWSSFEVATTDANHEVRFDYVNKDTSVSNYRLMVYLRVTSGGEQLMLAFYPGDARLAKFVSGAWVLVDQNFSATTVERDIHDKDRLRGKTRAIQGRARMALT